MNLPLFTPASDPGPSFVNLLTSQDQLVLLSADSSDLLENNTSSQTSELVHGTTVIACKWADGIIMAGDRRATAGSLISHRSMEKIFSADSHSGIAISGLAGPAVEMVKLFQLQLEHYEKLEDRSLSLEGKANQLSFFMRNNLPAAMRGMVVVPIFAGYDLAKEAGRLFKYDITGGCYEEQEFVAVGSGSLHASTVIKLGHKLDLGKDDAIQLVLNALFQAADEDTGTGGPDPLRGIYPTISVITKDGYEALQESEISEKFNELVLKV